MSHNKAVEFTLKLYDDESVRTKLRVMNNMEALFDDARNDVPDEYYDLIQGMKLGESLKLRIEIING
jgi:hypothetical protein